MIEGGWLYIWSAYALSVAALGVLTAFVLVRAAHWSNRVRGLERRQ